MRRRGSFRPSRDPHQWAFSVDSPWNMPLSNSATFLASDGSNRTYNLALLPETTGINHDANSIAVYYAKYSDPVWTVTVDWTWGAYYRPAQYYVYIHIPADAVPTGGEATWVIMDPDGVHWHEMWLPYNIVAGTSCQTASYWKNDATWNGLAYGPTEDMAGGPRCYRGSCIGGLIRAFDVQQGAIRHALVMAADGGQMLVTGGVSGYCQGWVWPAAGQDSLSCTSGDSYTGLNHVGTLAAIPPSISIASLGLTTPEAVMIAEAAQNYGVYPMMDRTGSAGVSGGGYHIMYAEWPGVPDAWVASASQDYNIDKIRHALQIVTNTSESTPGGAPFDGTSIGRRANLAPSF